MDKFLTIGFLSKLSLKKKVQEAQAVNEEEMQNNLNRAKENLRLFINKD